MNENTISMYYYEETCDCQYVKRGQNEICGRESINSLHGKWYCGTDKYGHYWMELRKYESLCRQYCPLLGLRPRSPSGSRRNVYIIIHKRFK